MAKKNTRDIPLPSSDGMFGGPGDPKKKKSTYTAKDSINYEGMMERQYKDLLEYTQPKHWKKGLPSTKAHVLNARISLRNDSISKNPYGNRVKKKK
jgi:hypothetical protein